MSLEIIDLFRVPLCKKDLDLNNQEILSSCLELRNNDPLGRTISNSGGWQSNDIPGATPVTKPLVDEILAAAQELSENLIINPLRIANLWVNISGQNHFNWPHTHSDSVYSGVYYVHVPGNSGDIEFKHHAFDLMYVPEANQKNEYTSGSWCLPSRTGTLYLFPGWLTHFVHPNRSSEERVSISFNLTFANR